MSKALSMWLSGEKIEGIPCDTAGRETLPLQGNVSERDPDPPLSFPPHMCSVILISPYVLPAMRVAVLTNGFPAAIVHYQPRVNRRVVFFGPEILAPHVDSSLLVPLPEI